MDPKGRVRYGQHCWEVMRFFEVGPDWRKKFVDFFMSWSLPIPARCFLASMMISLHCLTLPPLNSASPKPHHHGAAEYAQGLSTFRPKSISLTFFEYFPHVFITETNKPD